MRPGFSLVFTQKCVCEELISKKELALENLGGLWPIQILKDAKIGKFVVMKAFLRI